MVASVEVRRERVRKNLPDHMALPVDENGLARRQRRDGTRHGV